MALIASARALLGRIPWQLPVGIAAIVALIFLVGRFETAFHDWKQGVYYSGVSAERQRWTTAQAEAGKKNAERVVVAERQTTTVTEETNRALQAANDDLRARYDRLRAQKPAAVPGAPLCSATPGFPDTTGCTFDEGARAGLLDLAERADGFAERINAAVDWYDAQVALNEHQRAEEAAQAAKPGVSQ